MSKLYLIPNLLGGDDISILPEQTRQITCGIDVFIVENLRNARRYLVKVGIKRAGKVIDELTFHQLEKVRKKKRINIDKYYHLLDPIFEGKDIGLLSEAGCPAVADPGAIIVELAHQRGIEVVPLVGPSSLLLALMSSGLNGQNFAFVGYLPIHQVERVKRIRQLEQRLLAEGQTQLFIETPYRNRQLVDSLLKTCHPDTQLCIAIDLTLPSQKVITRSIRTWKKFQDKLDIHKRPTMFLLGT